MVASIGKVSSAAASTKYFESDDYYAKDSAAHRQASAWQGKGVAELGLRGHINSAQFRAILEGHVGDTGKRLGRMREGAFQHKPGTDITFSAPKSVSLATLVLFALWGWGWRVFWGGFGFRGAYPIFGSA